MTFADVNGSHRSDVKLGAVTTRELIDLRQRPDHELDSTTTRAYDQLRCVQQQTATGCARNSMGTRSRVVVKRVRNPFTRARPAIPTMRAFADEGTEGGMEPAKGNKSKCSEERSDCILSTWRTMGGPRSRAKRAPREPRRERVRV